MVNSLEPLIDLRHHESMPSDATTPATQSTVAPHDTQANQDHLDHLDRPRVDAPCGPVVGTWRDVSARDRGQVAPPAQAPRFRRSAAFLGIPVAEPPVDGLRLMAPVRRRPWTEPRDATTYGPTPQRRPFGETTTIPEPTYPGDDTLNVNVFTPSPERAGAGHGLPVLVWIYGGGFNGGATSFPVHDGARLANRGVVLVSLAYRVGVLGFFAHPELSAESPSRTSGNYGLLDIDSAAVRITLFADDRAESQWNRNLSRTTWLPI